MHVPDKKVYIYKDKEEKLLIQSAPLSEDIDLTEEYLQGRLERGITSEDFNFDGYRDLLVIRIKGMKSVWYDIYLYNPDSSKFTKNDRLSELESPSADPSKKIINYYTYGGMAGGSYVKGIYEWIGKQLTETRKEEQTVESTEAEKFLRTVYVLNENKELKPVSRVEISFDKKTDKEIHCLIEGDWSEHLKSEPIFTDDMNKVLKKNAVNGKCN